MRDRYMMGVAIMTKIVMVIHDDRDDRDDDEDDHDDRNNA